MQAPLPSLRNTLHSCIGDSATSGPLQKPLVHRCPQTLPGSQVDPIASPPPKGKGPYSLAPLLAIGVPFPLGTLHSKKRPYSPPSCLALYRGPSGASLPFLQGKPL